MQAREYADAARAVALATKPTRYDYPARSLALAEILLKQSGESSLDRARAHHRHHGLIFRDTRSGKITEEFEAASVGLIAKPMISAQDGRLGTFELWHRSAREDPYVGELKHHHLAGGYRSSIEILGTPRDERMPLLSDNGLSLFDCLTHIPDLLSFLTSLGVESECLRGKISADVHEKQQRVVLHFTLHPSGKADAFLDEMRVPPGLVDRLEYKDYPGGGYISLTTDVASTDQGGLVLPPASATNKEEFRCWMGPQPLNEFGYIYVALFIVGNYARYYPDRWVHDVESSAPLALVTEELLAIAEARMPWLTLGELARGYHVYTG